MPPEKPVQYSRQSYDEVESSIKDIQGSVKEGDSLDVLRDKAAEKKKLEAERTGLYSQAFDQALEDDKKFDETRNQQAEADRMEADRLLREIRGETPVEASEQNKEDKLSVELREGNKENEKSAAKVIGESAKNVETVAAAKDQILGSSDVRGQKIRTNEDASRPLSDFAPAEADPEDLKKNGGLYSGKIKGEEQAKLFADLPWDQKMMKGILDKVRSVSRNTAEALELMWDNGDTRSPLMVQGAGDKFMDFGFGKNRVPGSRAVGVDFLRGGEYKAGMKGAIDRSYEAKEENEGEALNRRVMASSGVAAVGALMGGAASASEFLVPAAASQLGFVGGAAFGGVVVGVPLVAGVVAWRLYKYFQNKRMQRRQTESLDKL